MSRAEPSFSGFAMRYGWRNLRRNQRRSVLTVATVALSVFFSLVALRFAEASMKLWKDGIIEYGAAHAQLRTQAAWKSYQGLARDHFLSPSEALGADLFKDERVAAISERLKFSGMLAAGKKSLYFLGESFDPAQEALVCPQVLNKNNYEGEFLSAARSDGVVIGRLLAETMDLEVGDSATIMANTMDGQVNSYDVTVLGIVDAPILELSRRLVYFHLNLARKILGVDKGYTELAVRLKDQDSLPSWLDSFKPRAAAEGLIALAWWDLQPFVLKIEAVLHSIVGVISFLLFFSAGIAILNIIYLTVEERTVEIGTLMAIGARAKAIWMLFTLEAAIIGLVGGAVGAVVANLAVIVMGQVGFPFRNPFGAGFVFIYPTISLWTTLAVCVAAVVISLVAAFIPAAKSTRIEPVNAFRRIMN